VLCNACGLFLKLHGRPRPISLKTDVIKSRNRVKTSQHGKKRESGDGLGLPPALSQPVGGLAAAHPDVASGGVLHHAHPQHHLPPHAVDGLPPPQRIPTPNGAGISRSNTPNPNIAPQHIFDTVTLAPEFHSPSLTTFRQPSPSALSLNGTSNLEQPQSHEALVAQNSHLRTRVSELEVINGLFRGRVAELEQSHEEARRTEKRHEEEIERLRSDAETAEHRLADALKRIGELEDASASPSRKRARRSGGGGETDGEEVSSGASNGADPPPGSSNFMMP
jgi:GATA-binding protein, other eukaryote